jgi:DNA-binding MarR family transcriptional regulator
MESNRDEDFESEDEDNDDEDEDEDEDRETRAERLQTAASEVRSCVATHARRLARNMMLRYRRYLKPHCITVTELQVLAEIALRPTVTAATLSSALELDKSTVSRIVERMVENDWLGVSWPRDAREVPLVLHVGAEERLLAALAAWREAHHSVVGWLGDDAASLKRLAEQVRPPPPPERCGPRCGDR